jgi:dipeptidyl aminopeptidase/acylaminoacyl peptidase
MLEDEKFDAGSDHWVVTYWDKVIRSSNYSDSFLDDISPINHVDKVQVPVLIIAGREDKVVPYYQSKNMYKALKRADKDATYTLIRNVGHHFRHAEMRVKLLQEMDTFLNIHL